MLRLAVFRVTGVLASACGLIWRRTSAQLSPGEGGGGEGVLPYSLSGGVPLGSRKPYPLLDQILQMLWPYTRLKMFNCSWFQSFVSDPIKRDPILDQFSVITRPYTRLNGLKTIPFPAAHTRIASIWEYPPPPPSRTHDRRYGLMFTVDLESVDIDGQPI